MELELLKPDKNGQITLPDHLDSLFNKLGMQLRFCTISGKNEILTLVHMCQMAEEYFKKPEINLKDKRKELRLSLRDINKETGLSISTISRLENGKDVMHSFYNKLTNFYNNKS